MSSRFGLIGILLMFTCAPCFAQTQDSVLEQIQFNQKLNASNPLDSRFIDESGQPVTLKTYFQDKPVLLAMVYYECPMLCTLVINGILRTLNATPLTVGKDFDVVFISIDPDETPDLAQAKKDSVMGGYAHVSHPEGWHLLTGTRENIDAVADAIGFEYVYDAQMDQYAHASGFTVNTPAGKVSRYFFGIEFSSRDLRLALVESSQGKIGSIIDQVLLFCYHYNPMTGKYGLAINRIIRVVGSATAIGLFGLIGWFLSQERKRLGMNH